MEKTWASGALELLKHADEHINKGEAFDQRIAFISIDNSVETAIRTFIFMPFSLSKVKFSFKEKEEIGNSFPKMVNLLNEKANNKISGIELSDIEFYHRLRNQLYHDGTGLSVDKNHLEAYKTIGELLLKNLFNIEFNYSTTDKSLSSLIILWEEIDKLIKQLFLTNNIDFSRTFKWEEALQKNIFTEHQISLFTELKRIRNEQVHSLSNEINLTRISYGIEIASELRKTLEKEMKDNILTYFKEHPTEVFAIRAIGHIFSISKSFATQIIESLEKEGKLISGIEEETGIKLFQIC
ncbi:hypothetical protein [Cyclobacterium marinum]|uniref:Uncharacterized protein n=1 Tax=Cyclobacterium marinum (strain ATCC 25205 / DSM 745 / LMG 13164 / NCIMB 1802) TaxID=880070 RepID=G0IZN1_CYCMS|nr:hypothetical protein [Cyclobacterium marinum]AEL25695.1 hypothetical protein Cycma_1947 [Cyclobacterium marinum DSM 745]